MEVNVCSHSHLVNRPSTFGHTLRAPLTLTIRRHVAGSARSAPTRVVIDEGIVHLNAGKPMGRQPFVDDRHFRFAEEVVLRQIRMGFQPLLDIRKAQLRHAGGVI